MSENKKGKQKFIESIRNVCSMYDASAQSAAIDSIRYPKNKQIKKSAERYVALCDDRHIVENKIIDLIHVYWP